MCSIINGALKTVPSDDSSRFWCAKGRPYSYSRVTALSYLISSCSPSLERSPAPATAPLADMLHFLFCRRLELIRPEVARGRIFHSRMRALRVASTPSAKPSCEHCRRRTRQCLTAFFLICLIFCRFALSTTFWDVTLAYHRSTFVTHLTFTEDFHCILLYYCILHALQKWR